MEEKRESHRCQTLNSSLLADEDDENIYMARQTNQQLQKTPIKSLKEPPIEKKGKLFTKDVEEH